MPPYDKLKSLPQASTRLKLGLTFEILDATAHHISDTQAADRLQKARQHLFTTIHERTRNTG